MSTAELDVVTITTIGQWERWLAKNHERTPQGVWLRLFNKGASKKSPPIAEVVEVALCYGWIDGQAKRFDDESRVQRFTPRRARSMWSRINTERAERLIKEGRMQPAGLAAIEAAKADGRWANAYETLNKRNLFAIVHRVTTAKKPETRARRIAAIVDQLAREEKFY